MIRGTTSEDVRDKDIEAFGRVLCDHDSELKELLMWADRCPFCESLALDLLEEDSTHKHYIYCDNCGCCGPIASRPNLAVSLWNVRTQEPEIETTQV